LAGLPFLIYAPALADWLNVDPIYAFSMLTTGGSPNLAPGFAGWNDPNAGWQTEALGRLAANQWLSGEIPWWNSFTGAGVPLAAEMQASSLFLPFVLLLALNHGVVLLKIAMQIVAGFATYALLRHLMLRRIAALTGALLYEFNGCIAWTAHAALLPVPFLPLLLLGIEHARAASLVTDQLPTKLVPSGWRTIALAIAFSLYAGFPETAYLNGLLAFLWAGYRLSTDPHGARVGFISRLAAGGVIGLLLASPLLWSFVHYLPLSELAERLSVAQNTIGQRPPGFALYLFPYLFGPIAAFSGNDPSGTLDWVWSRAGGYLGLTVFLVALSALVAGSRERELRWLLAIWIAIALAETAAMPGIEKIFQMIPLMDHIMFSRYAVSSWILAAVILASFAIDDRLRENIPGNRTQWAVALFCATAAVVAIIAAWPMVRLLSENVPHFRRYPAGALLWGSATFTLAVFLLVRRKQMATILVAALLVTESILFFAFPVIVSGIRHQKLDLPAIKFLRDNLGLQRFYTLGPFSPNYGAYFGLASINSDYEPTPTAWADYIRNELDPKSDVRMFMGNFPPEPSWHTRELQLHLSAYEELGVKYVLSPTETDPFVSFIEAPVEPIGNVALPLEAGKSFHGNIPGDLVSPGYISAFGIQIGTYSGASTGRIAVEVCVAKTCATGETPLENAPDNKILTIPLDRPLSFQAGDTLRYTISHPEGSDVAIWLWRTSNPALQFSESLGSGLAPKWLLYYREVQHRPRQVYADQLLAIYELENVAPYFETRGGPCRLTVSRRHEVTASCEEPAVLVRREMSFPGWHATLNRVETPIDTLDPFFQTVQLPAGNSQVEFSYRPPRITWTYGAFLLGMLGLLLASISRSALGRTSLVLSGMGARRA